MFVRFFKQFRSIYEDYFRVLKTEVFHSPYVGKIMLQRIVGIMPFSILKREQEQIQKTIINISIRVDTVEIHIQAF